MDDQAAARYELGFRVRHMEAEGVEFQRLFEAIMAKAYPDDFIACEPWGSEGDRKCDGYLRSQKTLFQVYAPKRLQLSRTITKLRDDFMGALPYWREHFDTWVFVHKFDALPPRVIDLILQLERDHPSIKIKEWGYQNLLEQVQKLDRRGLSSLFGNSMEGSGDDVLDDNVSGLCARLHNITLATLHRTNTVNDGNNILNGQTKLADSLYVSRDQETILLDRLSRSDFVSRPLLVTGDPGVGKSSLLWSIGQQRLRDDPILNRTWLMDAEDVLLVFGTIDRGHFTTIEQLRTTLAQMASSEPPLLLIDTVDVVLNRRDASATFKDIVVQLARLNLQIVMTSRPGEAQQLAYLEPNLLRLGEYSDREFAEAVRKYAQKYAAVHEDDPSDMYANQLIAAVALGYPIKEIALNPLTLRMLFSIYAPQNINHSEINIVSLYREFWERRVSRDIRTDGPSLPDNNQDDASAAAHALAITMLSEGKADLYEDMARACIKELRATSFELDILIRRGVVQRFASENGPKVEFFHQTFFEHAAARGLLTLAKGRGLEELYARYTRTGYNYFLGCILERALVLAEFGTSAIQRVAKDMALSMAAGVDSLASSAVYIFAHKDTDDPDLARLIKELVTRRNPIVVERLLELAGNVRGQRRPALIPLIGQMLQFSDFRRGEVALQILERIGHQFPDQVSRYFESVRLQDSILADPFRTAKLRKVYYRVLEIIAPINAPWVWSELVTLYANASKRAAGEADCLECLRIVERYFDHWGTPTVATKLEQDVAEKVGRARTKQDIRVARSLGRLYAIEWQRTNAKLISIVQIINNKGGRISALFPQIFGLSALVAKADPQIICDFMMDCLATARTEVGHYLATIAWAGAFAEVQKSSGKEFEHVLELIDLKMAALPAEQASFFRQRLIEMVNLSDLDVRLISRLGLEDRDNWFPFWTDRKFMGRRLFDGIEAGFENARLALEEIRIRPGVHGRLLKAISIQVQQRPVEGPEVAYAFELATAIRDPKPVLRIIERLRPDQKAVIGDPQPILGLVKRIDRLGDVTSRRLAGKFFLHFERIGIECGLSNYEIFEQIGKEKDDTSKQYYLEILNNRIRANATPSKQWLERLFMLEEKAGPASRAMLVQVACSILDAVPELMELYIERIIDLAFKHSPDSRHLAPLALPLYKLNDMRSTLIFAICEDLIQRLNTVSTATVNGEYSRIARLFVLAATRSDAVWRNRLLQKIPMLKPEVARIIIGVLNTLDLDEFEQCYAIAMGNKSIPAATGKRLAEMKRARNRMAGVDPWPELLIICKQAD